MRVNQHCYFVEKYKGFEIMHYRQRTWESEFYRIYKEEKLASLIVAGSPKGCKNIINTHLRNTA